MQHPDLRLLVGDRFAAVCGKCLLPSPPMTAPGAESAWAELLRFGWSLFQSPLPGARAYALCPACTANPPDAARDAVQARKRRKRR